MLETERAESLADRLERSLHAGRQALELGVAVPMTVVLYHLSGRLETRIMHGATSEREIEWARQTLHRHIRNQPITCMLMIEDMLWHEGMPERGANPREDPRTGRALVALGFTPTEKQGMIQPYRRLKSGKLTWQKIKEVTGATNMDHWNPWRHLA